MATKKQAQVKAQKLPGGKVKVMVTLPDLSSALQMAKKMGVKSNPVSRKNIAEGFWANGVFHPIRHSSDYRPEALGGAEGARARSGRRTTPRKKTKRKK